MAKPGQPPGHQHPKFKGARNLSGSGYVVVTHPDRGGKVYEHVLVAERALGKRLPPEAEVHHVNDDKTDNRNSNMVICQDEAYHRLLHARARRFREFGRMDVKRCSSCREVKPLSNFHMNRRAWDGRAGWCMACRKEQSK